MAAVVPAVVAVPVVPEIDQLNQCLEWIGFPVENERLSIMQDAFTSYADIQEMNEKDVTELSASFSRRTNTNGRIAFGIRRTKKLMHLLHWVHDATRCSYSPSLDGYTQASFLAALSVAGERADVRCQIKEKSDVKAKEASPGPLISENKWTEWEPKFKNYSIQISRCTTVYWAYSYKPHHSI